LAFNDPATIVTGHISMNNTEDYESMQHVFRRYSKFISFWFTDRQTDNKRQQESHTPRTVHTY